MSYEYTSTAASKIFNFEPALSNLNVSEYLCNSQTCQCKESKLLCTTWPCYHWRSKGHRECQTGNLLLKDQNTENQIGSTGKQQKRFWNPLSLCKNIVQKRASGSQISL